MFIEEIVLDGFKTYGTRTRIGPFDRSFNAITGRNGSGKSNILDAICFVLGISNLSRIRVNTLQELIYKQGQAGVTKASVSIIFNNEDKDQSPSGYQDCPKITVTRQVQLNGTSKYAINGVSAQIQRVRSLFHSIQLNVNNPHFLIIQGRIREVIRMQPMALLELLQEAAGTAMFAENKERVKRVLERKQKKLDEIDEILDGEIKPQLEVLRKDVATLDTIQKNERSLDRLTRAAAIVELKTIEHNTTRRGAQKAGLESGITAMKREVEGLASSITTLDKEIEQLRHQRDDRESAETQRALGEAEERLAVRKQELEQAIAIHDEHLQALAAAEQLCGSISQDKEAAQKTLAKHLKESRATTEKYKALVEERSNVEATIGELTGKAAGGDGSGKNEGESLRERLAELASSKALLEGKMATLKQQIEKLHGDVAKSEKELNKESATVEPLEREMASCKEELLTLTQERQSSEEYSKMKRGKGGDRSSTELKAELDRREKERSRLIDKLTMLSERVPGELVRSSVEGQKIDRSYPNGVLGNSVSLMHIPEQWRVACEAAVGAKLLSVVVERFSDGRRLLDSKILKRRCKILALDKLMPSSIPEASRQILRDQKLGCVASDVVETDTSALALQREGVDVSLVVKYLFGTTVLCQTSAEARRVAFDQKLGLQLRAVSEDGDVYEPAGIINGGSRKTGKESVLGLFDLIHKMQMDIKTSEEDISTLKQDMAGQMRHEQEDAKRASRIAALETRVSGIQDRLKVGRFGHISSVLAEQRERLEKSSAELLTLQEEHKKVTAEHKSCNDIVEKVNAINETADKEKELQKEKDRLQAISKTLKAQQKQFDSATEQQAELEKCVKAKELELEEEKNRLEKTHKPLFQQSLASVSDAKEAYASQAKCVEERKKKLDEQLAQLSKKNKRLSEKEEEVVEQRRRLGDLNVKILETENMVVKLEAEAEQDANRKANLIGRNSWLKSEEGVASVDLSGLPQDHQQIIRKVAEISASLSEMSKGVNRNAAIQYEHVERDSKNLFDKRDRLKADRTKIEQTIEEFDARKNKALQETFECVKRDISSIFSRLLPGADATLLPVEGDGGDILNGIKFGVCLGGVWKQSLTELSGGQMSLLALSLILAFLRYKPAPVYILDEIDAALDLSHTQQIGALLKEKFEGAQFVVVSLKEGMFDNANVVFRVKFTGGVSSVNRTVNKR